LLMGYWWAALRRTKRPVSRELVQFHRREQRQKLKLILASIIRFKKIDKYRLEPQLLDTRAEVVPDGFSNDSKADNPRILSQNQL